MATLVEELHESREDFLRGHALGVYGALFSPDSALLAYGVRGVSGEGHHSEGITQQKQFTLKLRETTDLFAPVAMPVPRPSLLKAATVGGALVFSPDGAWLASASARHVDLWRMPDGRRIAFRDFPAQVHTLAYSPDGRWLACGLSGNALSFILGGNQVALWEIAGENPMLSSRDVALTAHHAPITALVFTPNADALLSAGADRTLRRWQVGDTWREVLPCFHHDCPILALSHATDYFAAGDQRGRVLIGVSNALAPLGESHQGAVRALAFSPDSQLLASASDDGTLQLWDATKRRNLGVIGAHNGGANAVSFSADGSLLVSSGADFAVKIWRI